MLRTSQFCQRTQGRAERVWKRAGILPCVSEHDWTTDCIGCDDGLASFLSRAEVPSTCLARVNKLSLGLDALASRVCVSIIRQGAERLQHPKFQCTGSDR